MLDLPLLLPSSAEQPQALGRRAVQSEGRGPAVIPSPQRSREVPTSPPSKRWNLRRGTRPPRPSGVIASHAAPLTPPHAPHTHLPVPHPSPRSLRRDRPGRISIGWGRGRGAAPLTCAGPRQPRPLRAALRPCAPPPRGSLGRGRPLWAARGSGRGGPSGGGSGGRANPRPPTEAAAKPALS